VVVGGGPVGLRKACGLVSAGAKVRLVAPVISSDEAVLEGLEWIRRAYRHGDLAGAFLAFAATDKPKVNAAVAAEARQAGILVNVADHPNEGDFLLPAVLRRGSLSIAVGTGGKSPAAAVLVRDYLGKTLGPEWGIFMELAGCLRDWFARKGRTQDSSTVCRRLAAAGVVECIAAGDAAAVDHLLAGMGHEGLTVTALGLDLKKGFPG